MGCSTWRRTMPTSPATCQTSRSRRRASRSSWARSNDRGEEARPVSSPNSLVFAALAANGGHAVAILAGGLAALAAGGTGFFGGDLVRDSLFVSGLAALAARLPRLLRAELMRRPFQVRGLAPFAGDFPLLCLIHGTEASLAACWHSSPPLTWTLHGTSAQRNIGPAIR